VADVLRDGMNALGRWRYLPIKANGQPGAARYLRRLGVITFRPFCPVVLNIDSGGLLNISAFEQPSNVLGIRAALKCSRHSVCQTAFDPKPTTVKGTRQKTLRELTAISIRIDGQRRHTTSGLR